MLFPEIVPVACKTCDNNAIATTVQLIMQKSFSDLEYATKMKLTRRDRFLAKIDSVTPWSKLHNLIEPHYPDVEGAGRPPIGLARMLRMYVVRRCFGLSKKLEHLKASIRAKVEHPFHVVKNLFRHRKARFVAWRRTRHNCSRGLVSQIRCWLADNFASLKPEFRPEDEKCGGMHQRWRHQPV